MRNLIITTACLAVVLSAPMGALADDPQESPTRVVVIDDEERIVVSLDGSELTVTSEDEDGTSVHVVDMSQIGYLVSDALSDLEVLQDLQLDMHMGGDNRLNFSWDDRTFEVDVDAILAQTSAALAVGLEEFDTEQWSELRHRDSDAEDLHRELDALRDELRELRRELRDRDDDQGE